MAEHRRQHESFKQPLAVHPAAYPVVCGAEGKGRNAEKLRERKETLFGQASFIKFLKQDDAVGIIREFSNQQKTLAYEKLIDPGTKPEELNLVRTELMIHQRYSDFFDLAEQQGKEAMKELQRMEAANGEPVTEEETDAGQ